MSAAEVRREVVALCQVGHRLGLIRNRAGGYGRPHGVSAQAFGRAQALAVAHELETLGVLLGRLEQLTAPPAPKPARLPKAGTVAHAVLQSLAYDRAGRDHGHLRMLTGLTDEELVARISGAGPNSVRPRRVELVRNGLVEAVPDTAPTRWRLTATGYVLITGGLLTHLMSDDLLDECGTAGPGSLSVVTEAERVTCPACRQLPQVAGRG